ncbi:MAG: 23S rRNA (uracil(1939)-C(5))-methyltransferase RlmD [Anaerotruncus sp.]|nr:23S rRNA (uracil(1939)-C(5))-methyltransferase RlmD [Anaerotruncus sp.]
MPQKNEIAQIRIEDMTQEGSGVGHLQDGMAVFVPHCAVGDLLEVRLIKINKTHCFGRIEQVLQPSADRISPDCPVSRRCGGCVFRHVSYPAELGYKQRFVQENLRRIGHLALQTEPILPSPLVDGYRNKAQYPIRMQQGRLTAGFFAPRTHEVIDCVSCRLQPKAFAQILQEILDFVQEQAISVYDEASQTGLLRHVYLRCGQHSGEIMVCLVLNGKTLPKQELLVQRLLQREPQIVSILLNINEQNTNVILGAQMQRLYGKPFLTDRLCGVEFCLSPHAFYQVNHPAAELLYGLAADYARLDQTQTVLDLYCGAGTIGLSMAHRCKQVIGVEIVAQAVENAIENARQNQIENARFLCADAAQAAAQLAAEGVRPQVVILDPPRKGCAAALLETVAQMAPQRVVYISCNSATLARDCAIFAGLGYQLGRCRPVDLFPRTAHVEAVALLEKKEVRKDESKDG